MGTATPQPATRSSEPAPMPAGGQRARPSWASQVTGRMIVLALVVGCLIGLPVYLYTDATIAGGIRHKGDRVIVDLKAMSDFEMDQVNATDEDIPKQWRELDGKRVECSGEMWAPYSAGGRLTGFQLCYSIAKCCFNGPPKVQHFVQVMVPEGRSVEYFQGLVRVTGKLKVGVIQSHGRVQSIYTLEVEAVSPV